MRTDYISPRFRNHATVAITHTIGKATPNSRKDACPDIACVSTEKFIPKNPVRKVIGRKITETIVNRSICSPWRWAYVDA